MLSALPNLNRVRIYGNPDISVDAGFCNDVARLLQDQGIGFSFFTSGIGGAKVMETVTDGINPSNVRKVIFSVATIDEKKLSEMKGVEISLKTITDGIECCNNLNIPFAMSIVIWPVNADEDFFEYQEFFKAYGALKLSCTLVRLREQWGAYHMFRRIKSLKSGKDTGQVQLRLIIVWQPMTSMS